MQIMVFWEEPIWNSSLSYKGWAVLSTWVKSKPNVCKEILTPSLIREKVQTEDFGRSGFEHQVASIQRPSPPRLCCAPTLPCKDHSGAGLWCSRVVGVDVFNNAWQIIVIYNPISDLLLSSESVQWVFGSFFLHLAGISHHRAFQAGVLLSIKTWIFGLFWIFCRKFTHFLVYLFYRPT